MPKELWEDAEKVRKLRNASDVSHYALGWNDLKKLDDDFHLARDTGRRIITRYAKWLAAQCAVENAAIPR